MLGQKRLAYVAGFKLKVIRFAEQWNYSVAARHFKPNEKQTRE